MVEDPFLSHGTDGTARARSLWGEIAWQLSGADAVTALGEADDVDSTGLVGQP